MTLSHDAPPPAAWGAALDRWLDTLDREGLRTGVRERLLVQSLLTRLAASGQLPATLQQTLALAAPLLCTSREQQRRYAVLLVAFIDAGAVAPGGPSAAADGKGTAADAAVPRYGSMLAAIALVIALVLLPWAAQRPARPPFDAAADGAASAAAAAASAAGATRATALPPAHAAQAFYVPPLSLPLQPPLPPAWAPPLRAVLLGAAALCALALVAVAVGQRRRQLALRALSADDDELDHHFLHDAEAVDVSPHPVLARAVARALRQRVAGEAQALDTGATLRATVAAQGAFSPRWRQLQRTPEYLALVDTRHACDHHAAYAHTLLAALQRAGVSLHVYGYDTTPAAGCWAHGALGNDDIATRQRLPLATLVNRAGRSRLLVFGTADALLQPATGELQPWLVPLRTLAERTWITPIPPHAWGADEQAADEAGFLVLPLQEAALPALAGWLTSRRPTLALDADTPQSWPALLRGSGGAAAGLAWVTRPDAPPPETVELLLQQLRQMLGGVRFQWLCACAVFPALMPPLTLALGQRLLMPLAPGERPLAPPASPPASASASDERLPVASASDQRLSTQLASGNAVSTLPSRGQRLSPQPASHEGSPVPPALGRLPSTGPPGLALGMAALAGLPWFRHGRMPAWLRRELLQRLAPDLRAVLDAEVRRRLDAALDAGSGPLLADIATRRRRLLAALQRQHGPLRDVVLADFIRDTTEPGLAQRLPEGLRRRLFKGGNPAAGWRPAVLALPAALALAGAIAATPLWNALVGTVPQPALAVVQDVALTDSATTRVDDVTVKSLGERMVVVRDQWRLFSAVLTAVSVGPSRQIAFDVLTSAIVQYGETPISKAGSGGLGIETAASRLQLLAANGTAFGAPLDTGGAAVAQAGFSASGSRVLALLADGRLRVWGRPWENVQIDVLACAGADPAASLAGDVARLISGWGQQTPLGVAAYTAPLWKALNPQAAEPAPGEIVISSETQRPLAEAIASTLVQWQAPQRQWAVRFVSGAPIGPGAASSGVASAVTTPPIAIGACPPNGTAAPAGDAAPLLAGLAPAEHAALLQRVERMFAPDADTRKSATAQLMQDRAALSDAVPLAVWRARQMLGTVDAAMSGVINTLVLLQQAPPATLNRDRAAIDALLAQAEGNGPQTREQIASLRTLLDARAALKPAISIQIAGGFQRAFAEALARRLQANGLAVAGIEDIGKRAPDAPEVRVQGFSDRRIARNLQAASTAVLQRSAALVSLRADAANDTYEIWLDRGLCVTRVVAGCSAAGQTLGNAPTPGPPLTSAEQPTNGPGQVQAKAQSPDAAVKALNKAVDPAGQPLQQSPVQSPAPSQALSQFSPQQQQQQQQQRSQQQQQSQQQQSPYAATAPVATAAGTDSGLALVARFEGYLAKPVLHAGGTPTIGYGHSLTADEAAAGTILIDGQPVPWGVGLTEPQARRLLRADLVPAYAAVDRLVSVPLSPQQRDALASFVFNQGSGTLASSTLLQQLNAGDYDGVPGKLLRWTTVAGKQMPGLQARREAEALLWRDGGVPAPPRGATKK